MSEAVSTTGVLVRWKPRTYTIVSSSVANPTVITTLVPHGYQTGDSATIAGHTGSTPAVDGVRTITRTGPTTFTVPLNVTVAGTGGTAAPNGATASYRTFAEIVRVTPPGFSRNKLESSTHNDGAESYVLGILRQKDPAMSINYIGGDASHQALLNHILGNANIDLEIDFPSGVVYRGPCRVQKFEIVEATVDAIQQADLAFSWSGPVTPTIE